MDLLHRDVIRFALLISLLSPVLKIRLLACVCRYSWLVILVTLKMMLRKLADFVASFL